VKAGGVEEIRVITERLYQLRHRGMIVGYDGGVEPARSSLDPCGVHFSSYPFVGIAPPDSKQHTIALREFHAGIVAADHNGQFAYAWPFAV